MTGTKAVEIAANQAEQGSKIAGTQPTQEDIPDSSEGEVVVTATPPRPAGEP